MNSGMFAVVFGAISGIFVLVLFATLAADFGCVLSVHIDNYRRNTTSWQQGNLADGLAAAVLA